MCSLPILEFAAERAQRPFTPVYPDADAVYEQEATLAIDDIEPQIYLPGGIETSVDVAEAAGQRIDHAFIGSCGSGMYEDLATAAAFLKGRQVASAVRLFVAPGSEKLYLGSPATVAASAVTGAITDPRTVSQAATETSLNQFKNRLATDKHG